MPCGVRRVQIAPLPTPIPTERPWTALTRALHSSSAAAASLTAVIAFGAAQLPEGGLVALLPAGSHAASKGTRSKEAPRKLIGVVTVLHAASHFHANRPREASN